ncbi:ABC transporter substrate-binding protein [Xanthomonas sp. NCPPB 1128]|uniref:substrate-binding domain-containing protein n=1 Tax=Xanthomonas sp. NCPPB 1128 TaxID=1775876 RepID=UPI00065AD7CD|nr:substrate-binding domain-containing protein [Xanthomonas sp. NCPPB 1128]KMM74480.1 ABC transporter substrate-binding protein [Xanthomonas sp. NCPPB 1128]
MRRSLIPLILAALLLASTSASAATAPGADRPAPPTTLTVLSSGGIMGAIRAVAPDYERATGVTLHIEAAPSMGDTPQAIPNRLARHEPADVLLMVGAALDTLVAGGQARPASRVDLGESYIAMAVKQGAPTPDISTMEAFRKTLLDSKSVAYSDSASGVYLSRTLFPKMRLGDGFAAKARMIPAEPVGAVVARGEAQLGFQQLSELKPVPGIAIVGLIPRQAQQMTLYSGAVATASTQPQAAQALLDYLASPAAAKAIAASSLTPLAGTK